MKVTVSQTSVDLFLNNIICNSFNLDNKLSDIKERLNNIACIILNLDPWLSDINKLLNISAFGRFRLSKNIPVFQTLTNHSFSNSLNIVSKVQVTEKCLVFRQLAEYKKNTLYSQLL